jgi:hypothetical protein
MFQETLLFRHVIFLCYSSQIVVRVANQILVGNGDKVVRI